MSERTGISWTDATWNPIRGCSLVSPGCSNCYAMKQAHRFSGSGGAYEGLTKMTSHGPVWTGEGRPIPSMLEEPLRWRRGQRIFVNSMSDLFHEDVPDSFIDQVFAVMALAPRHTFQVLTKRPRRMLAYIAEGGRAASVFDVARNSELGYRAHGERLPPQSWPLPNIWLGVSVEDQQRADEHIPVLLQTPAAVRFLSCEPLLGAVHVGMYLSRTNMPGLSMMPGFRDPLPGLDWIIVGGESGPKARPFNVHWARDIVAQCRAAGVAPFVKQLGARPYFENPSARINLPIRHCQHVADDETGQAWTILRDRAGADPSEWPEDLRVQEFPLVVPNA